MNSSERRVRDATVQPAAGYLGHHPETIRVMARSGDFPNAYKAGKAKVNSPLRIPRADVDRYRALQPRASGKVPVSGNGSPEVAESFAKP